MVSRRSLQLPIVLAVVMILLLSVLAVGWVILAVRSALESATWAGAYWAILSVGATFFALVVAGVVIYLTLTIKSINLNQRQSNFIDSVTHELKSPITSMKLYLQTLSRREIQPDEQQRFYGVMLEDLNRLDQLVDHLLDVARLDKPRRARLSHEAIALDELLARCAAIVGARYEHGSQVIQLDVRPVTVVAPLVDLELVLRNLIDNALKYAGNPPRVSIRVTVEGSRAVTRITDNGRGIPKHLRHKVFGRFVRLGTELQRERPGTGLGLYIVWTMVRRLRGQIRFSSGPQGEGTTVCLSLPISRQSRSPEATSPAATHVLATASADRASQQSAG